MSAHRRGSAGGRGLQLRVAPPAGPLACPCPIAPAPLAARTVLTPASKPIHIPTAEHNVLEFWRAIDAFKTQQKLSEGRPEFSFFDGPPFATGLPHYGHLLAGTIKVR